MTLRLRGEGIAEIDSQPASVTSLLDEGFARVDVDAVVWYIAVGDWATRRVAWANGFAFTGTRCDSWVASLRKDDSREPKTPWHVAPVLETDRLRLRPLRETDADRLGETLTDERTQRFVGRYLAGDRTDPTAKILRQLDLNARGEGYNWCIADRETDRLIGHIHLWGLGGFDPTSVQVGYSVHPSARGRGVLTEALGLVVAWSFRPEAEGGFGRRRLSLTTAASNAASRHAAEKAGFTHVASEPAAFPVGESDFEDAVTYHQLNQRWVP